MRPKPDCLDTAQLESALQKLPGWQLQEGKLFKQYRFEDFQSAFAFMTQVAALAEAQDHHPEWFNVYATLRVQLVTHEAGGITERDVRLARSMEALLAGDSEGCSD